MTQERSSRRAFLKEATLTAGAVGLAGGLMVVAACGAPQGKVLPKMDEAQAKDWLSRWEATSSSLYYTPNTWLVLALTLLVASRVVYGFWRASHAWYTTPAGTSWLAASGAAGSLAVGALVIGYYLAFWFGIRRRARGHRGSPRARAAPSRP